MMIDLKTIQRTHFVGIGGIGLSAIARLFLSWGKRVRGSDSSLETPVVDGLRRAGAKMFTGHRANQVPPDCELLIYSNAITEDNPELLVARRRGISTLSYPETLGLIAKDKFVIAVAGTHGKTTTTAMLAKILVAGGLDPTVIVGSLLKGSTALSDRTLAPSNLIVGRSDYFLVEADEYKRGFLNLEPKLLIITNIDADHLDYYKDLADVKSAFAELAKQSKQVIRAEDYHQIKLPIKLPLFGAHNQANAQAAIAAASALGVNEDVARHTLETFIAPWRRFELKGSTEAGALIYDDYAHNPEKIKAVLAGAKEQYPDRRIIALFQPHLYSRTKLLFNELVAALSLADLIGVLPIYAAREALDPAVRSEALVVAMSARGKEAIYLENFKQAEEWVQRVVAKDEVLITIGAGDIFALAERLVYNQVNE